MAPAKVTLTACVAGNPLKGWGPDTIPGSDPPELTPPDDEWEDQEYAYDTLDSAKAFVAEMESHPQVTTHIELHAVNDVGEWETIYRTDEGDGTLEAAHPSTQTERDDAARAEAALIPPEAPVLPLARQGGGQ